MNNNNLVKLNRALQDYNLARKRGDKEAAAKYARKIDMIRRDVPQLKHVPRETS